MANARGCLKSTLIGCGLLVLVSGTGIAVFVGVMLAGGGNRDEVREEVREHAAPSALSVADPAPLMLTHPGRLVLDLSQGEFQVRPAAPGEGLKIDADFDPAVHAVDQDVVFAPDSTWTAYVTMRRTMSAMQALARQIGGKETKAAVTVSVPPDVPVELVVLAEQGGGTVDLGGLWLRTVDITVRQGGFELVCPEPAREPVARLRLHARMGGVSAEGLGNLSPRELVVDCGMGGADLGLDGDWRGDCDASFRARLGGLNVRLPRDLDVVAAGTLPEGMDLPTLRRTDAEVPLPVLRLVVDQRFGGVEVSR